MQGPTGVFVSKEEESERMKKERCIYLFIYFSGDFIYTPNIYIYRPESCKEPEENKNKFLERFYSLTAYSFVVAISTCR